MRISWLCFLVSSVRRAINDFRETDFDANFKEYENVGEEYSRTISGMT